MDDIGQLPAETEQLTIVLDGALAAYIRERVEAGHYASSNALISQVLRDWHDSDDLCGISADVIRERIAEADADPGPSMTDAELEAYFVNRGPSRAMTATQA